VKIAHVFTILSVMRVYNKTCLWVTESIHHIVRTT